MHLDLISIVMPVKNTERYLTSCLDSIIGQSEQHWELIAIDDHSIDNSYEIIKSYAQRDKRISLHKNDGNGIISALQLAYQLTSGNIITRMDSDDLMPANKLSLMKNALLDKGAKTIITGKVQYFSDKEVSNGYIKYQNWLNRLCDSNTHWEHLFEECVVPSPAWMMFKNDFKIAGAFDSQQYPEDYDLVFRWNEAGMKIYGLKELIHLWREHPTRTSRTDENYQQAAFFRLKLFHFFKCKRDANRPLIVFGAGEKGRIVADLLIGLNEEFFWINSYAEKLKNTNKTAYESFLLPITELKKLNNPQIIITAAKNKNGSQIKEYMMQHSWLESHHYFFFR